MRHRHNAIAIYFVLFLAWTLTWLATTTLARSAPLTAVSALTSAVGPQRDETAQSMQLAQYNAQQQMQQRQWQIYQQQMQQRQWQIYQQQMRQRQQQIYQQQMQQRQQQIYQQQRQQQIYQQQMQQRQQRQQQIYQQQMQQRQQQIYQQQMQQRAQQEAARRAQLAAQQEAARRAQLAAQQEAARRAQLAAQQEAARRAQLAAQQEAARRAQLAAQQEAARRAQLAAQQEAARRAQLAAQQEAARRAQLAAQQEAARRAQLAAPVTVGTPVTIGRPATVGTPVTIGRPATVGTPVTIGRPATVGTPVTIGRPATVGTPVTIGRPATVGTPVTIGRPATVGTPVIIGTPATVGTPATIGTAVTTGTSVTTGTPVIVGRSAVGGTSVTVGQPYNASTTVPSGQWNSLPTSGIQTATTSPAKIPPSGVTVSNNVSSVTGGSSQPVVSPPVAVRTVQLPNGAVVGIDAKGNIVSGDPTAGRNNMISPPPLGPSGLVAQSPSNTPPVTGAQQPSPAPCAVTSSGSSWNATCGNTAIAGFGSGSMQSAGIAPTSAPTNSNSWNSLPTVAKPMGGPNSQQSAAVPATPSAAISAPPPPGQFGSLPTASMVNTTPTTFPQTVSLPSLSNAGSTPNQVTANTFPTVDQDVLNGANFIVQKNNQFLASPVGVSVVNVGSKAGELASKLIPGPAGQVLERVGDVKDATDIATAYQTDGLFGAAQASAKIFVERKVVEYAMGVGADNALKLGATEGVVTESAVAGTAFVYGGLAVGTLYGSYWIGSKTIAPMLAPSIGTAMFNADQQYLGGFLFTPHDPH